MSVSQVAFRGFANPVNPTPAELRGWAYNPKAVALSAMPVDWDLMVVNARLINTIFMLAMDRRCPSRRFALHCLYIYAADGIRNRFRAHPKRKLRKFVEEAERDGDDLMASWAYNARMLLARPDLFAYRDWYEGGLVRTPRLLNRQPAARQLTRSAATDPQRRG